MLLKQLTKQEIKHGYFLLLPRNLLVFHSFMRSKPVKGDTALQKPTKDPHSSPVKRKNKNSTRRKTKCDVKVGAYKF